MKVKNQIKEKYNFLHDIVKAPKRQREKFLLQTQPKNIHTICEAVHNILIGRCTSSNKQICSRMKLLKKQMQKLANPTLKVDQKRLILSNNQVGSGIFSLIASVVIPFLVNLLSKKRK